MTGYECSYTRQLWQEEVNGQLFEAIESQLDCGQFAEEVDARMKVETDMELLEQEIKRAQKTLNSTMKNKISLEVEMDSLPADTSHYQRKHQDIQRRLDTNMIQIDLMERLAIAYQWTYDPVYPCDVILI